MKQTIRKIIHWIAVAFFLLMSFVAFSSSSPAGGIIGLLIAVLLIPNDKIDRLWERIPKGKRMVKLAVCLVGMSLIIGLTPTSSGSSSELEASAVTPATMEVSRTVSAPQATKLAEIKNTPAPTPSVKVANTSTPVPSSTATPTAPPMSTPTPTFTPGVIPTPTPTPATLTPDDCGWVADSSYKDGGYCSYHPEWYSDTDKVTKQQETTTVSSSERQSSGQSNLDTYDNPYSGSAPYIANSNPQGNHRFHYANCSSVADMDPANRVEFFTREDAIAAGYTPCGRCHP